MKDKYRILFIISILTGAIPFLGGWTIFLTWLAGRYWFAEDYDDLEIAGFFWLMICFFVACAGLLVLATYVIINRRQLHLRMLLALIVILINIPAVSVILSWQAKEDRKVFIRLTNQSESDISQLTLISRTFEPVKIGPLPQSESNIFSYRPTYKPFGERLYLEADSLKLIMFINGIQDTSSFPSIPQGRCKHLIIDKQLKIERLSSPLSSMSIPASEICTHQVLKRSKNEKFASFTVKVQCE